MSADDNYIPLGPVPCNEDAADIGAPGYAADGPRECRAYLLAIRKKLGPEPAGARLAVMGFPHEFGRYYEVVVHFDPARPASVQYAQRCEREAPESWAEVGMKPPLGCRFDLRGR